MIFMLPVPSKDIFQATCRAVHLSSHGADAKGVASPPGGFHGAAVFFPPGPGTTDAGHVTVLPEYYGI